MTLNLRLKADSAGMFVIFVYPPTEALQVIIFPNFFFFPNFCSLLPRLDTCASIVRSRNLFCRKEFSLYIWKRISLLRLSDSGWFSCNWADGTRSVFLVKWRKKWYFVFLLLKLNPNGNFSTKRRLLEAFQLSKISAHGNAAKVTMSFPGKNPFEKAFLIIFLPHGATRLTSRLPWLHFPSNEAGKAGESVEIHPF